MSSPAGLRAVRPSRSKRLCSTRSEEHTSELQSLRHLVCRLLLEKKKKKKDYNKNSTSESRPITFLTHQVAPVVSLLWLSSFVSRPGCLLSFFFFFFFFFINPAPPKISPFPLPAPLPI